MRLNWHDEVLFPQEAAGSNLEAIYKALDCLRQGDAQAVWMPYMGLTIIVMPSNLTVRCSGILRNMCLISRQTG